MDNCYSIKLFGVDKKYSSCTTNSHNILTPSYLVKYFFMLFKKDSLSFPSLQDILSQQIWVVVIILQLIKFYSKESISIK